MKTFQDWCIDTIVHILKNRKSYRGTLSDQGYVYAIDAIVKHYASMHYCKLPNVAKEGKEHVNLWWDHMSQDRREVMFKSVMMSSAARKIATEKNLTVKRAKEKLHWEHIVPCAKVIKALCGLEDISVDSVRRCFAHNKLVLIKKDEQSYLDGKGSRFENKDIEFVRENFSETDYALAKEYLNERPKDCGTALLRLARLSNKGVVFCTYDDEQELAPKEWLNYLNDSKYLLGTCSFGR